MKQSSNELFELIACLTLSEKRYCSLYLQKHSVSAENRYLKLFMALSKAADYNSQDAKKQLGYEMKQGHYSVLKKQLFEQLLDALHQFDLFSNPEQQLMRGIHQCHLLLQKGLFKSCKKRINTLVRLAEQMNHYEAQLQLQQLIMMMKARNYYHHETEADLKQWNEDTQTILHELEITQRYRYLSSRVYKMQYESGARGKEQARKMKPLLQLPEFADEKKATTNRAQLDFLQVNALYHFTNMETERAAAYNERFFMLLERNPLLLQLHADRYFSVLNNYLIDCLVLKRYKTLEEGLAKMRALPAHAAFKRLVNFEANVFRLGYLLEMNYMLAIQNFKAAYKKIPAIEAGLQKFGDRVVKHNRITLHYLMAYVCFVLHKHNEALDHLQFILQQKETAVAEQLQLAARFLQLLCHFEKGDGPLLSSLIKSLRRYLNQDPATEMQRAVISFIQRANKQPKVTPAQWKELETQLLHLATNKASAGAMSLFNYLDWVKGHLVR